MKKIVMLSCLLSPFSFASQVLFNPIVSSTSTSSSVSNPASNYLTANENASSVVLIEPLGIGYELGDVNSLMEKLDDLQDAIDTGASTLAEAEDLEDEFDAFLEKAGEEGYLKGTGSASLVIFPSIYTNERGGVFTFDFNYGGIWKFSVLDDPDGITVDNSTFELTTDSAVYQQIVIANTFGLGYRESLRLNDYSEILIGAKFNLTQMNLSRKFSSIEYLSEDEIEGEMTSTNVGVDLGLLWVIDSFSLGLTVNNINEPKYELGELSCGTGTSAAAIANCTVLGTIDSAGEIDLTGYYVAERQAKVDFFLSSPGNAINIQGSYDLNSITDVTGDEYQWAEIALNYLSDSFFVPGLRVGYKKNLVGSELSYVNAGYTLFRYLNLDAGMSLDTVTYEGTNYPRSFYVNLGLAAAF